MQFPSRIQRYQSSIEFFHSYQRFRFYSYFQNVPTQAEYQEFTAINSFIKHICLGPNISSEYKESKKVFQPLFSTHNNVLRGAVAMRGRGGIGCVPKKYTLCFLFE